MDTLPQELLVEIFKYCIDSPSEYFLTFSGGLRWGEQVDAYPPPSSSQEQAPTRPSDSTRCGLLLVCKQWLNICSPLLYESLKLRTPKDVLAVHEVLSAHPCLAQAVRRLRIETTNIEDLHKVVKLTTNVHTVYISLQMLETHSELAADPVSSFYTALCNLNPTRVLLWKPHTAIHFSPEQSQTVEEAEAALAQVIPRWTRLAHFELSNHQTLAPSIGFSLSTLPNLCDIHMSAIGALRSLRQGSLQTVAENTSLAKISCRGVAHAFYTEECKRAFPGRAATLLAVEGDT
ncbi:hypothetical protein BC835DRAFT_1412289 [Cytidiella melzeri]|nr:hypothetical protein BC835DRAFT_1412289 [Cytidiella melzeri]